MNPVLHCYADDADHVIAASPEDADAVWREHVGEDHDESECGRWVLCDPDATLRINLDDGRGSQEKTIREWIAEFGRCFLCSENY
jgi:hypothetical protein